MPRPTLKELAKNDRQLARFMERAEKKVRERQERTNLLTVTHNSYKTNHLPKTRDLGEKASDAINRCILP